MLYICRSSTNTNAINIVTNHREPEALHRPEPIRFRAPHGVQGEGRGNLVFIGIVSSLRSSHDTFLITFVLENPLKGPGFDKKISSDIILQNSIIKGPEDIEGQKPQEDQP